MSASPQAKDWSDDGYMRDCVRDWREDIEHYRGQKDAFMWVQPWLMESLLDRLQELEKVGMVVEESGPTDPPPRY